MKGKIGKVLASYAGVAGVALLAAAVGAVQAAPAKHAPLKRKPAAAAPRPATQDWLHTVRRTPQGTYVLGNPQARVKLIEYMSYTCPHCGAFAAESGAVLKEQMVRSGSLSLELRPIVRDQIDLGATLLARCAGAAGFYTLTEAMLTTQENWLGIAYNFLEKDAARFALEPPLEQVRAGVQASGLIDLAMANGVSAQRIDACFVDKAELAQMLEVANAARKVVTGTPSFVISGTKVDVANWAALEPLIRAQGAR